MKMRRKDFLISSVLAISVLWIDFLSPLVWKSLHYYHFKYLKQMSLKSSDHSFGLSLSKPYINTLNCSDANQKPRIERRLGVFLYYNYIPSKRFFRCHEWVTFTTYLKPGTLANLETLVEKWQGPMSVSVVVDQHDYLHTLELIIHLRECVSSLIKDFVSFHFIFEDSNFLVEVFKPKEIRQYFNNICETHGQKLQYHSEQSRDISFANFARNVAIEGSLTHFVVSSELYLHPSLDFVSKFMDFLQSNPSEVFDQVPVTEDSPPLKFSNLFVLPVFIIKQGTELPRNKDELVRFRSEKKAALFSTDASPFNQHFGKYDKWIEREENGKLDIVSFGRTRMFLYDWEPVYVGTKLEPAYDERLFMEGPHAKYAKYVEMCCSEYIYKVLDEGYFLLKEEDASYYRPEHQQNEQLKLQEKFQNEMDTLKNIIREIRSIYPTCNSCSNLDRKSF